MKKGTKGIRSFSTGKGLLKSKGTKIKNNKTKRNNITEKIEEVAFIYIFKIGNIKRKKATFSSEEDRK